MSHEYSVVIIYKQKRLGVFKSIWIKANMFEPHANFENSKEVFWLKNMKMADQECFHYNCHFESLIFAFEANEFIDLRLKLISNVSA